MSIPIRAIVLLTRLIGSSKYRVWCADDGQRDAIRDGLGVARGCGLA